MDEQRVPRGPNSGAELPDWGPPPTRVSSLPPRSTATWSPPAQGPTQVAIPAAAAIPAADRQPPPPLPGSVPMPGVPYRPPSRPTPASPAPWLLVPILTAAGLAEIAIRSNRTSVAAALATVVAGGLIVSGHHRPRLQVLAPVAMAVAAMTMAAIRTSSWVVGPCLAVAGLGLITASQNKLRSQEGVLTMISYLLADTMAAPGWLAGPFRKLSTASGQQRFSARGWLLVVATIVPITALLASGDAVFGQLLLQAGSGSVIGHLVVTALLVPAMAALALGARRVDSSAALGSHGSHGSAHRNAGSGNGGPGKAGPAAGTSSLSMVEATMVLGAIIVVMGLWAATQILVAVGGTERLLATADLTAAENARSGFFQMVAVVALLTGVIAALNRFTGRTSPSEHLRFLAMTMVVGLETLALVWSSYSRLALYINGFGNTMLRTSVAWFLAWLVVALVVLITSIHLTRPGNAGTWPAVTSRGAAFLLAGVWVVAFAVYNPEAAVARTNLDRDETLVSLDERYLAEELGYDAIPTVVDGLDDLEAQTADSLKQRLCRIDPPSGSYGPLGWNRSADRAEQALLSLNCP